MTKGTAQGNMTRDLKKPEPLVILDNARAIASPLKNVSPVTPTV